MGTKQTGSLPPWLCLLSGSWEYFELLCLWREGKISKCQKAASERPGQECRGSGPAWVCLGAGDAPRGPAPSRSRMAPSGSRMLGSNRPENFLFKKASDPTKSGFLRVVPRQNGFLNFLGPGHGQARLKTHVAKLQPPGSPIGGLGKRGPWVAAQNPQFRRSGWGLGLRTSHRLQARLLLTWGPHVESHSLRVTEPLRIPQGFDSGLSRGEGEGTQLPWLNAVSQTGPWPQSYMDREFSSAVVCVCV